MIKTSYSKFAMLFNSHWLWIRC